MSDSKNYRTSHGFFQLLRKINGRRISFVGIGLRFGQRTNIRRSQNVLTGFTEDVLNSDRLS